MLNKSTLHCQFFLLVPGLLDTKEGMELLSLFGTTADIKVLPDPAVSRNTHGPLHNLLLSPFNCSPPILPLLCGPGWSLETVDHVLDFNQLLA